MNRKLKIGWHCPGEMAAPAPVPTRWEDIAIVCFSLAALVWLVFGQTMGFDFVSYDDPVYVYDNPHVTAGLSFGGMVWAFTQFSASNWHPLTWISHMLDCQLYGVHPGGHHLTNVLLHAIAAMLVFLVLRQMTGAFWRSAFAAAVFAIHPLRAESVAWVAERKDLLSGVLFLLSLGAYVFYARRPWSWLRYGLVVGCFSLGLMAKPMVVTFPIVALLLDYWPLRRISLASPGHGPRFPSIRRGVLLEKIPLLALSAVACLLTILAQQATIGSLRQFTLPMRLANTLESYVIYLGQLFHPVALAVFYPYLAQGVDWLAVVLSGVLLPAISAAAWIFRGRHPYLLVGWLWYVVMLVPVIGLVQVGDQSHANRYTYLPEIGLVFALVWLVADLSVEWPYRRWILGAGAAAILAPLFMIARYETSFWKDSETLWKHALANTTDNSTAQNNVAWMFAAHPDPAKRDGRRAVELAEAAVMLDGYRDSLKVDTLAAAYAEDGRFPEAVDTARRALAIAESGSGDRATSELVQSHLVQLQAGEPIRDNALLGPGH